MSRYAALSDDDYYLSSKPMSETTFAFFLLFLFYFSILLIVIFYKMCEDPTSPTAAAADADSIQVVVHRDGLDVAAISSLPTHTYADSAAASTCAVCLGDYKDGDLERLLPQCGHIFHRSCVDQWLMDHATCPICRAPAAPPAAAHRI